MSAAGTLRAVRRAGATAGLAASVALELRSAHARGAGGHADRAGLLHRAARRFLRLHGVELRVEGPIPAGSVLLASNHVSWLDPLVVAAAAPCVPVSKADVAGWPLVGRLAVGLGTVFFTRGDARSGVKVLRSAGQALALGLPVLNFPEGTTTDGAAVLPFRRGLFGLACRAGVPVVPVAVAYEPRWLAWTGDQTFAPHYLRLAAAVRVRAVVRFGRTLGPAWPGGSAGLAAAARERVQALLDGGGHAAAVGA